MSTHVDSRRSIAAWLEAEAPDRAPSRLIEASRERVRTTSQRTAWWPARKVSNRNRFATLAVAAAAVVVVAFGVVGLAQLDAPTTGPAAPLASPTPRPSAAAPSSAVDGPTSAGDGAVEVVWPQRTVEEVRQAQERANAGDPGYIWQLDPQGVAKRFLRDVLGWDEFLKTGSGMWVRCAPGEPNPLYPSPPQDSGGDRCAPTIDDLRYETVSLDVVPGEEDGGEDAVIWVVHEWAMSEPIMQVDPRVAETEVTAQLEAWLAARIAGKGAEGTVATEDDRGDGRCNRGLEAVCRIDEVPLLYATTSGAPYERYELHRVSGPRWPKAEMDFIVRLFADDGATVVRQPIMWIDRQRDVRTELGFLSLVTAMTENGRPVAVPFVLLDGVVTVAAAPPWAVSHQDFNFGLSLDDPEGGVERVTFVPDPYLLTTQRQTGPASVDAATLARRIQSDPTFEATAPVDVTVGGAEGLYLDVTLAPGATVYRDEDGRTSVLHSSVLHPYSGATRWGALIDPDSRMRIYLVDLPEGSANRTLAIAIGAPAERFETVLKAAAPVVDSIEFHAH